MDGKSCPLQQVLHFGEANKTHRTPATRIACLGEETNHRAPWPPPCVPVSRVAGAASPRAAATTRTSSCSHDTSRRFGEGGREGREAEISRSCRRGGVDCRHDSRGWRRSAAGAESRSVTGVEEPYTVARREQQAAGLRISRVAGVQEPNAVARRVDFDGGRISRGRRRGRAARCRAVRSSPLSSSPLLRLRQGAICRRLHQARRRRCSRRWTFTPWCGSSQKIESFSSGGGYGGGGQDGGASISRRGRLRSSNAFEERGDAFLYISSLLGGKMRPAFPSSVGELFR
jgi:hypothetical protein